MIYAALSIDHYIGLYEMPLRNLIQMAFQVHHDRKQIKTKYKFQILEN
jgi:hypothetical protein